MQLFRRRITRRATAVGIAAILSAGVAGATTLHTMTVNGGTGSLGATAFDQNSASGSALQGEVAAAPNTSLKIPFGVLGDYDPSGSTFGVGVVGVSTTGYAVGAEAFGNNPTMLALAAGNGIGLEAVTPSSSASAAIYSEAKGNGDAGDFYGDNGGYGIYAIAYDALGVYGETDGGGYEGVQGDSYDSGSDSAGVYGYSENYDGVHGAVSNGSAGIAGLNTGTTGGYGSYARNTGTNGFGAYGIENDATAVTSSNTVFYDAGSYGQSSNGPGVYGVDVHNTGTPVSYAAANRDPGVYAYANDGSGVFAFSNNWIGATITNSSSYATLSINANDSSDTSSFLIEASAGNIATDARLFTVDRSGNVAISGSYQTAVARKSGTDSAVYSAQQTEATLEDVGSAQLVNGTAQVALAPDFRDAIDGSSPYMVFLTPYGENNGLYIASRTPAGFVVREVHSGRSTLSFDYRIVAKPYGVHRARMPLLTRRGATGKSAMVAGSGRPAAFNGAAPDTHLAGKAPSKTPDKLRRQRTAPPALRPLVALRNPLASR